MQHFKAKQYKQSLYWFEKAAEQDIPQAQFNLGHMYLSGTGVVQSNAEAVKWWEKAAEGNYPQAQFNLGKLYFVGNLVNQDLEKSQYWLTKAASNDDEKAKQLLSQITQEPSNIDVFSSPSNGSNLIGSVAKGKNSKVIREDGEWLLISNVVIPVWVHKNYVRINDQTAAITSNKVNVRTKPLVNTNTLIGQLGAQDKGRLLEQKGDWYRISVATSAWVKKADYSR